MVSGSLRVLWFPAQIKLTIVESSIKHQNPNPIIKHADGISLYKKFFFYFLHQIRICVQEKYSIYKQKTFNLITIDISLSP